MDLSSTAGVLLLIIPILLIFAGYVWAGGFWVALAMWLIGIALAGSMALGVALLSGVLYFG